MKITRILILAALMMGCSSVPTDPDIGKAKDALELAYIERVKPPEASFVRCGYRLLENRHVVKCGVSFGSTETAMNGFWEIVKEGDKAVTYAMNGKAQTALEKIGKSEEFKSGAGVRQNLDITSAEKAFD